MSGIYHIIDPPLQTATVFAYFYDNADETAVNAQVNCIINLLNQKIPLTPFVKGVRGI